MPKDMFEKVLESRETQIANLVFEESQLKDRIQQLEETIREIHLGINHYFTDTNYYICRGHLHSGYIDQILQDTKKKCEQALPELKE